MKLSKKKVFALALAVCLLATLSLGSLAWFTAEDKVTNNFFVGESTTDPDDVFGVDVWEEVDTDRDPATVLEVVGKGDTTENTAGYELLLPGEVMTKKPYLTNTGKHPQFARAIVTVTDATILREAMEGMWGDAAKFLAGTNEHWVLDNILFTKDDTLVYIFYYDQVLAAGATTEPLFEAVVIPTGLTLEQAQSIDNFQVNVLGQVIQSEHLADPETPGAMVTDAKKAFNLYFDATGTVAGIPEGDIKATANAGQNLGTVEVYYTVGEDGNAEASFTDITASVTKAFVVVPETYLNNTFIFDSCHLTVADGAYIVDFGDVGGQQVCISTDTTINGETAYAIYQRDQAELQKYFRNIEVWTIVWFNG